MEGSGLRINTTIDSDAHTNLRFRSSSKMTKKSGSKHHPYRTKKKRGPQQKRPPKRILHPDEFEAHFEVREIPGQGRGLFSRIELPANCRLPYLGKLIKQVEYNQLAEWNCLFPEDRYLEYIMASNSKGYYIDAHPRWDDSSLKGSEHDIPNTLLLSHNNTHLESKKPRAPPPHMKPQTKSQAQAPVPLHWCARYINEPCAKETANMVIIRGPFCVTIRPIAKGEQLTAKYGSKFRRNYKVGRAPLRPKWL